MSEINLDEFLDNLERDYTPFHEIEPLDTGGQNERSSISDSNLGSIRSGNDGGIPSRQTNEYGSTREYRKMATEGEDS